MHTYITTAETTATPELTLTPTKDMDEINIYNNGDGHYTVEIHFSSTTGTSTLKIPSARISANLIASAYGETELEIIASGGVVSE